MSVSGIEKHIKSGKEEFMVLTNGYLSARKMTKKELGERLGICEQSVERNLRNGTFKLPQILAISYILGFDPELTSRILYRAKRG